MRIKIHTVYKTAKAFTVYSLKPKYSKHAISALVQHNIQYRVLLRRYLWVFFVLSLKHMYILQFRAFLSSDQLGFKHSLATWLVETKAGGVACVWHTHGPTICLCFAQPQEPRVGFPGAGGKEPTAGPRSLVGHSPQGLVAELRVWILYLKRRENQSQNILQYVK